MDHARRIISDGAVHFEGGKIVDVGPSERVKSRNRTTDYHIDARGKVLLPNFVNAHTHTFQTLRKGLGADQSLNDWLKNVIWPLSGIITSEDMALGAEASALEAVKTGCSFLLDNTTIGSSVEAARYMAESYKKVGVKATIALGLTQRTRRAEIWNIPKERFPYNVEESIKMVREAAMHLKQDREFGISVLPSPVTIFSSGPELYKAAWELSKELKTGFTTHIAETQSEVKSTIEDYSCTEVEFLQKFGILGLKTVLAHCVWLDQEEMDILATSGCSVAHNPICNMYLGSGIANVSEMRKRGVNIALGTDGGACGTSHDMFDTIRATCLLQKARNQNPQALTGYQALEMATINGASAVGLDDTLGSVEVGKSADFFLLNLHALRTVPVGDVTSIVAYYANAANVDSVYVNGNLLVKDGEHQKLDEESLLRRIQERANEIEASVRSRSK